MGNQLVFSLKLFRYLVSRNFIPVEVTENKNNPNLKVFVFERTDNLMNEIREFKK